MSYEFDEHEFCAICGKDADGERWFCHFYGERSRVTLCSPRCADLYLHRPTVVSIEAKGKPVGYEADVS